MAVEAAIPHECTLSLPPVLFRSPHRRSSGTSYDVAPDGRFILPENIEVREDVRLLVRVVPN